MFEITALTSASILGGFTGQKHWQLNGEKIQITVKFHHDCVVRNPTHSICLPLVGACAMEVTFPVSHMKTYDDFLKCIYSRIFQRTGLWKAMRWRLQITLTVDPSAASKSPLIFSCFLLQNLLVCTLWANFFAEAITFVFQFTF